MAKKPGRPKAPPTPPPATMDGQAFKAGLKEAGMLMVEFAARTGKNRVTVSDWVTHNTVPPYAAWLVRLLLERKRLAAALAAAIRGDAKPD